MRITLRLLRGAFGAFGSVAPRPTAALAEFIFRRPPRHTARPAEEQFIATGEPMELGAGGARLRGWSWGRGPTVVLVHGWGSRSGRWSVLAPQLVEAGFRVVAYDGPGHGRSRGRFASMPEFADALAAVAEQVGPVHGLVGHSLGGAAVALAMHRGLAANRAVLLAPAGDAESFSHRFAEVLNLPVRVRDRMQHNLEVKFGIRWEELELARLVGEMRAPLLVVHDAEDPDVPWEHGAGIARAWPEAELVTTTGLGHRRLLADPEVIGRVTSFLLAQDPVS